MRSRYTVRDRAVRAGAWDVAAPGRRVAGSTLGILGFGGTAKAFARSALALGFRENLIWSPKISAARIDGTLGDAATALGAVVRPVSFDRVFLDSDWVSIHFRSSPKRGASSERARWAHERDAALINISRGAVVDEEALVTALSEARLGGAGLDVFTVEPLPGHRLRSLPGVVLTDHSAYASRESICGARRRTAENASKVLQRDAESE